MHQAVRHLLSILRPEKVAEHSYQGAQAGTGPAGRLFGGQVLGQGLFAASLELGASLAHSMHASFLQRGVAAEPVHYEVSELRRSRSFRTVQVTATQKDASLLQMIVSHHVAEEGLNHQIPMDAVGPPQGEAYEQALLKVMTPGGFDDAQTTFSLPVEIRGVGGVGLFSTDPKPPQGRYWMRMRDRVPDDPPLHQALFAYASDYAIMGAALNPHPVAVTSLMSASLDHAVWFHRPFRMDDWVLFELDSPVAHGARGIGRGLLYTREGELVASCVQESLLRPRS